MKKKWRLQKVINDKLFPRYLGSFSIDSIEKSHCFLSFSLYFSLKLHWKKVSITFNTFQCHSIPFNTFQYFSSNLSLNLNRYRQIRTSNNKKHRISFFERFYIVFAFWFLVSGHWEPQKVGKTEKWAGLFSFSIFILWRN